MGAREGDAGDNDDRQADNSGDKRPGGGDEPRIEVEDRDPGRRQRAAEENDGNETEEEAERFAGSGHGRAGPVM